MCKRILLVAFISLLVLWVDSPAHEKNKIDFVTTVDLALEGSELSANEAEKLEKMIKATPNDLASRIKLLGYYECRALESDAARESRRTHILWIIRNVPDAEIASLAYVHLDPVYDKEAYIEAKRAWLSQIEVNGQNGTLIGNAGQFFFHHDKELAENLLKQAQTLEPTNPKWLFLLAHLYPVGQSSKTSEIKKDAATKSLMELERASGIATDDEKFYMLDGLAKFAFEADEISKAELYATELLNLANSYKDDWNYGNAIHHGNLILGRIALKSGDLELAKEYLIRAGKTPGSPQLNSFGPNMMLAKELLEKGEKDIVLKYFQLCAVFWEGGKESLDDWTNTVKKGGIPDFGSSLDY